MGSASNTQLNIPDSTSTVSVSVIDGVRSFTGAPTGAFFGPGIEGFEKFDVVVFSFLVTHNDPSTSTTRKVLFDIGLPKDWDQYLPPSTVENIKGWVQAGASIDIPKNGAEIIADGGTDLKSIEAVIWSHPHWDHMGRPSLFPPSTALICGPGMKAAFGNGYPENEGAPYLTSEIEGRAFNELEFRSDLDIGEFKALDYFGDGSFYLLDVPGHCVAHMNALARVSSNPDTFILMGADSYHHASQLRPSKGVPLPETVDLGNGPVSTEIFRKLHPSSHFKDTSAGSTYDKFTKQSDFTTTPFFTIQQQTDGSTIAHDLTSARESIIKLQAFDADERVFMAPAHDFSLRDVVEYFPDNTMDEWKQKGWKEKARWLFLKDLEALANAA